MSSFVFDNFKKRFINGIIPSADSWYFIPVTNSFVSTYEHDDVKLRQYRTINDFKQANSEAFDFTLKPSAENINLDLEANNVLKQNLDEKKIWSPNEIAGSGLVDGTYIERTWNAVYDDEALENKPSYINTANSAYFMSLYGNTVSYNPYIADYIQSGFYYIRSKDELTWFANRSNSGNNCIIGVLGDSIEGVLNNDPIGKDEKYPFQGILDGNGFALIDINIMCDNVDNGIVGVLGNNGIIRNFQINNDVSLVCRKQLNLKHIKEDARDINAGILVGRNYGTIENINAYDLNKFGFSGFVPEVYSVTNKSDNYSWKDGKIRQKFDDANDNFFYMNHFCINSPGNVCPYVGYFAEGYYGEDRWAAASMMFTPSGSKSWPGIISEKDELRLKDDEGTHLFYVDASAVYKSVWSHEEATKIISTNNAGDLTAFAFNLLNSLSFVTGDLSSTISLPYFNTYNSECNFDLTNTGPATTSTVYNETNNTIFNIASRIAKLPIYYGLDVDGNYTCGVVKSCDKDGNWDAESWSGLNLCYNTNIIQKSMGFDKPEDIATVICPSAYLQTSMRMNPLARAAYNVGIIAGANYGTISSVSIKTSAQNLSNFVGFFGGLAGKQSCGNIRNNFVDICNDFIWSGNDNSYKVVYKNTPILPKALRNKFNDYLLPTNLRPTPETSSTANCNLDYLFSSFYDTDITVDTATQFLDDCVQYELKPIIIAGGLFGRYIPTLEYDAKSNYLTHKNCVVEYTNVIYKDNFKETSSGDITDEVLSSHLDKSIDNAMGIIAGKCDYAVNAVGANEKEISVTMMQVKNCNFSAATTTGPIISGYSTTGSAHSDPTCTSSVLTGREFRKISGEPILTECDKKYIGVYELNYNAVDCMAIATDLRPQMQQNDSTIMGSQSEYLFTTDYPFKVCNRKNEDDEYTNSKEASFYLNYDYLYLLNNRKDASLAPTYPNALDKKQLSEKIIEIKNTKTNITPGIVLYDNFYSDWPINPKDDWYCNGNNCSKKIWHRITEEYNTDVLFQEYSDVYFNKTSLSSYDNSIQRGDYVYGDKLKATIIPEEALGIQNTLNGYTFIKYGNRGYGTNLFIQRDYVTGGYPVKFDFPLSSFEGWFQGNTNPTYGSYNNPRIFEKNIRLWASTQLCPTGYDELENYNFADSNYLSANSSLSSFAEGEELNFNPGYVYNNSVIFNNKKEDNFFYYTYENTVKGEYYNSAFNQIDNNPFIKKFDVIYTNYNGNTNLGYVISGLSDSAFTIGQSPSPVEIRQHIKEATTAKPYTTTALSSSEEFGGFLVIDSSGNNVMFWENTNGVPMTGNTVSFPKQTVSLNSTSGLLLLEVK